MAIAPIDLQTIFSQVDKVGKTQAAQKEGQALQQAIQGAHIQKKTEEQIRQVNEAQNTGEGADKINDHSQRHNSGSGNEKKRKEEEEQEEEKKLGVLRDPYLGNKIDIRL
ncbi:MAG: hypothetical protein FWD14_05150 [Treponema sp.]|nr:hypothetical protein [Treponema sp.]